MPCLDPMLNMEGTNLMANNSNKELTTKCKVNNYPTCKSKINNTCNVKRALMCPNFPHHLQESKIGDSHGENAKRIVGGGERRD